MKPRRITQQELDGLWSDIERRAMLGRTIEGVIGGQQDVLAIAYLLAEVEHLEHQVYELAGPFARHLIARPVLGEGVVTHSGWPILVRRPVAPPR